MYCVARIYIFFTPVEAVMHVTCIRLVPCSIRDSEEEFYLLINPLKTEFLNKFI
jgi:hypothetical protein